MSPDSLQMEVQNVGGIEEDALTLDPGVTVLSGENATNRTSLLKSLMAGLGSDATPIRAGTDEGYVSLNIDGEEYTRTVTATDGSWYWDGTGVVDDVDTLELFGFLLGSNRVRQAVEAGENLYDVVMEPVDTDAIEAEKTEKKNELEAIKEREATIDEKKDRIFSLEEAIEEHEEERSELEAELDEINDEIDSIDESEIESEKIDANRELNEELTELHEREDELERKIEAKKSKLETREGELANVKDGDFDNVAELNKKVGELEVEIESIADEIESVESDKREMQPLRRFLSQVTSSDTSPSDINAVAKQYADEALTGSTGGGESVTDALVDDTSNCILCGNEIEEGHYQSMLSDVTSIISQINAKNDELHEKQDSLRSERDALERKIRETKKNENRIDELESDIASLEAEITELEDELASVRDERESVADELAALEDDVVEQAEDKTEELRSLESEKTGVKRDISSISSTIEQHEAEIEELQGEVSEIEALVEEKKPELEREIEALKGRVREIEKGVVDEFNSYMDDIVSRLSYEGVERIWIEQKTREKREGRRKVEEKFFDLHVVREIDGVTTEDVVSNLSESEREVTAIVFALTGYLAHDVADEFPVMLLDSVEMIDAQRLEELLSYINEHVEFVVVAALPEDTEAMDVGSVVKKTRESPA